MPPPPPLDADDAFADDPSTDEQDLLVVLRLSNRLMGTNDERAALEAFAEQLEAEVLAAGAGEYDGDEIGGGECVLFFCGPDAGRLMAVLRPLLQRSLLARGGHFVRLVAGPDGEMRRENVPI